MKTFKLRALSIIDNHEEKHEITFFDGLIINREDDASQWMVEAYLDKSYENYLNTLKESNEEIVLEVKISKDTNKPALFRTSMISVNDVGENMNVLFIGKIINEHQPKTENLYSN